MFCNNCRCNQRNNNSYNNWNYGCGCNNNWNPCNACENPFTNCCSCRVCRSTLNVDTNNLLG